MMVILFTDSDNRMSNTKSFRDRMIYLCKEWDNIKALNDITLDKDMYNYITNVMLKDMKS